MLVQILVKQDVPLHSLKRTISLLSKSETQTGHSTKEELRFPEVAISKFQRMRC